MKLHICAVGRARPGPEKDLADTYLARLTSLGRSQGIPSVAVHEIEEKRPLAGRALALREAERLAAAVPHGAPIVALDERGQSLTSAAFADRLRDWRDAGAGDSAFLIGGADGLDPGLRARADLCLALGAMTWPHQLVRALLAEQLYRAVTLLAGHPYHRA